MLKYIVLMAFLSSTVFANETNDWLTDNKYVAVCVSTEGKSDELVDEILKAKLQTELSNTTFVSGTNSLHRNELKKNISATAYSGYSKLPDERLQATIGESKCLGVRRTTE